MADRTLSTSELADLVGVTSRTVRNWVKSGIPCQEGPVPDRGGKRPKEFGERDAMNWIEANIQGGTTRQGRGSETRSAPAPAKTTRGKKRPSSAKAKKKGKEPAPPVKIGLQAPQVPIVLPTEPNQTPHTDDSLTEEELADKSTEALLQMGRNLEQAEQVTYSSWARAVNLNNQKRAAHLQAPYSVSELSVMQRSWHDNVTKRKAIEAALPKILQERGRYVDVFRVRTILERTLTGMCQSLDQVGIAIADQCVGKTAREIRTIIDDAVSDARRNIGEQWAELIRSE